MLATFFNAKIGHQHTKLVTNINCLQVGVFNIRHQHRKLVLPKLVTLSL